MIKISRDADSEMMKIEKDDVVVFEGNYWDFAGDPAGLEDFLDSIGVPCILEEYSYGD